MNEPSIASAAVGTVVAPPTNTPLAKTFDWVFVLKAAIAIFLMFGFGHLPPIEPLEPLGMQILGIFIGLLFAWICIGFVWPSLLSIIALSLTGLESMNSIIAGGFGNNITVFVLLMLVLVIYFERAGICERIAYWFLSRKIVVGRPWTLVSLIILASYIMATLTYSYPAMLILWNILYTICKDVGYKKGDVFPAFMVLGIGLAAQLGLTTLPIKSHSLLSIGILERTTQDAYTVNFFDYAAINIPITLFLLLLFVFMMRFVFKVNVDRLYSITEEKFAEHRNKKLTTQEKVAFGSIVFFIAIMAGPSILPADWMITGILKKFGMTGCIVLVFALLTMFRLDKKPILNFTETANNGKIGWEVVIMYAACMPVSDAMARPEVGITNIIVEYCMPVLSHLSSFEFLIITVIVITLLTQLLHNLVLAAIATPLLVQFSIAANCNPSMLVIVLCFAYGFSTTTPAASAASSLVFLNDWSPTKTTYKVLISHFIIGLAIVAAVFVPLIYMIY